MDGGMPSAAIEVLLQNLINVCKEEYSLIRGLNKDVEQLEKTLNTIQGYLNDAEKKSITEHAVKNWLRKLETTAFEADDVLDEFSYHLLHKKVKKMMSPKPQNKVLSCFSFLNSSITRPRNIALKIKKINEDFEYWNTKATGLNLQSIVMNAPAAANLNDSNSYIRDPIFVGRGDDEFKLVEKLAHIPQEKSVSILAIVGMGGMGKTTLTRKLVNDQKIKDRFGSILWVSVSQTFDPKLLYKKILSELGSQSTNGGNDESAQSFLRKLEKALEGKTYLLVLDDVWSEDSEWVNFINSISEATSTDGNAIIITTRNDKVASLAAPFYTHTLNGISDEDCWSIIKAIAPGGFEKIGREIAERCHRLPLAAHVVGGVLLHCKSERDWVRIKENWVSDVEGGKGISTILKWSYDHLPSPSLKKCFAYCSIFPKGAEIEKQDLIEQWMAEGFLPGDQMEMESEGEIFFNVLLRNSLLLVGRKDGDGNVESCAMHDLVHDMASSVLSPNRYMVLKRESSHVPKPVLDKHLRTLICKGGGISGEMFSELECLRVLTVEDDKVTELPDCRKGKLTHLRLLNVVHTSIKELPEWIGELYHLQTLRAYTEGLEKLPSTLKNLINLRHLDIDYEVELPAQIGRLTHLQTLPLFRVGDDKGYRIEELGGLNSLKGELTIRNLEKVQGKEEALKANMSKKPFLVALYFEWGSTRSEGGRNDESVLEGLEPHENVKKLRIQGFKGKRFPSWINNNLTQIELWDCEECEDMLTVQHWPNVEVLSLTGLKKVRSINTSFSSLISLKIQDLEGLERMPDQLFSANPSLKDLWISKCPKLRKLPDGLNTLNSLEVLVILECPNLESIGNPCGEPQSQGILSQLCIERCGGLKELPPQMVESWAPSLEALSLVKLSSLKNLPMLIHFLAKSAHLKRLKIVGVPILMATCGSVESWALGSLETLEIDVSKEWSMKSSVGIAKTVDGILQGCCNSLTRFTLKGVEKWEWVPASIQHLTALSHLKIKSSGVQKLPQWFGNLSSLKELCLKDCKKLRCSLPSFKRNIPHLTIKVDGCSI